MKRFDRLKDVITKVEYRNYRKDPKMRAAAAEKVEEVFRNDPTKLTTALKTKFAAEVDESLIRRKVPKEKRALTKMGKLKKLLTGE